MSNNRWTEWERGRVPKGCPGWENRVRNFLAGGLLPHQWTTVRHDQRRCAKCSGILSVDELMVSGERCGVPACSRCLDVVATAADSVTKPEHKPGDLGAVVAAGGLAVGDVCDPYVSRFN